MPLLNYTSQISTDRTLGEISKLLAKAGARSLLVKYDESGEPVSLSFLIASPRGDEGYHLPANIEATFRVLTRQSKRGQIQPRFATPEQAARVSWRILKDWVEAQLAIIATEMVTLDQVFLPYLAVSTGQSLYEWHKEQQRALPPPVEGTR